MFTISTVDCLSVLMAAGCYGQPGASTSIFRSVCTVCTADAPTIYSASAVDIATIDLFREYHDMGAPLYVMAMPEVALRSVESEA